MTRSTLRFHLSSPSFLNCSTPVEQLFISIRLGINISYVCEPLQIEDRPPPTTSSTSSTTVKISQPEVNASPPEFTKINVVVGEELHACIEHYQVPPPTSARAEDQEAASSSEATSDEPPKLFIFTTQKPVTKLYDRRHHLILL
jgi:hypothetical protein